MIKEVGIWPKNLSVSSYFNFLTLGTQLTGCLFGGTCWILLYSLSPKARETARLPFTVNRLTYWKIKKEKFLTSSHLHRKTYICYSFSFFNICRFVNHSEFFSFISVSTKKSSGISQIGNKDFLGFSVDENSDTGWPRKIIVIESIIIVLTVLFIFWKRLMLVR